MSKLVAVYSFPMYHIITDESGIRPVKGTLDAIAMAKSEPILSSEEFVDASLLNEGLYRPPG